MDGRTSVPGLYAVGEAASTGVHGANRLASNSLTEALITGRRAGELLGQDLPEPPAGLRPPARPARAWTRPSGRPWPRPCPGTPECCATAAAWNASGRRWAGPARRPGRGLDLATVEATSLHTVSVLVAAAALARAESRGCHRWRDRAARLAQRSRPATPWCASRRASPWPPARSSEAGASA